MSIENNLKTCASLESGTVNIKSSYIPKIAELPHVEIADLFKERGSEIIINQHNTDNKDYSMNGIILLVTDKEAVTQLVDAVKERFIKT
jgi:hypothetical protein